jgi:hypothetical protein
LVDDQTRTFIASELVIILSSLEDVEATDEELIQAINSLAEFVNREDLNAARSFAVRPPGTLTEEGRSALSLSCGGDTVGRCVLQPDR